MSFVLGPRSTRFVLAMIAVASAIYAFACIQGFRALELASSQELAEQVRATRIEPQNAEYWRQLGSTLLYRENNAQGALDAFRQATNLNPRDADAWMATALALQMLDRQDEERSAISRALNADPRRLEILWQAANLYAGLGDRSATLEQACVLLSHDRARGAAAMELARSVAAGVTAAECKAQGAHH